MKRTSRIASSARRTRPRGGSRPFALFGAMVLLAVTSSSVAAASDGPGPLGVTVVASATRQSARVGALFGADRASTLSGGHFCTASVVHSEGHDLIVTAAHCLGGSGALVFVPGYRNGKAPYGVWKVGRRFQPDGWSSGQREDSDIAFATVTAMGGAGGAGSRGSARSVEDVVGANRFAAGMATGATAVTVTGYPSATDEPITCTNRPTAQSATQQRIACPSFTGGTSGSPWVNGDSEVVGVLGGHEQGGTTADISYSVVLRREAAELYRDAAGDS
ncbi:trypsin-like peptidase domain-containing protein [Streptomyces sp. NPDC005423]|uniref:trypsin-like peptidase domain-containing protein n=1 Tax=Streptomyces sp. NPDC005423 TaxID=3155343 RepID=UPI0033BF5736